MKWIYYNNLIILDTLDSNINIIGEKKDEKELPNGFAKLIINFNEKKDPKEYENIDESIFLDIYKYKVKLVFYKYKIKNEICKDEDLEELKNISKIFKNKNFHYYEIETFSLISEWYYQKYKNKIDGDNINNLENSYNYLNFVIYLSNFYKVKKFDFYKKDELDIFTEDYFNTKNVINIIQKDKEKIIEKLNIFCNKYEYNNEYINIFSEFYY